MTLFMFRLCGMGMGFKIVAMTAHDLEGARKRMAHRYECQFDEPMRRSYARLIDECDVDGGAFCEFEFNP